MCNDIYFSANLCLSLQIISYFLGKASWFSYCTRSKRGYNWRRRKRSVKGREGETREYTAGHLLLGNNV